MPLTKIDQTPALVVIDLQQFIYAMPLTPAAKDVVERTNKLARIFRERKWPVALVRVNIASWSRVNSRKDGDNIDFSKLPSDWEEFSPELEQDKSDLIIAKPRWGAFTGTTLDYDLRQRGVTQVFVTGVATSAGVESTVRSASEHGYNVVPVIDAMSDRDIDAHNYSIEKVFPRLGECETTDKVLKMLASAAVPALR